MRTLFYNGAADPSPISQVRNRVALINKIVLSINLIKIDRMLKAILSSSLNRDSSTIPNTLYSICIFQL